MAGLADRDLALRCTRQVVPPSVCFSTFYSTSCRPVVAPRLHSLSAQYFGGGNHGTKETRQCIRQHRDSDHDTCARIRLYGAGDSAGTSARDISASAGAATAEGRRRAARVADTNLCRNAWNQITGETRTRAEHQGHARKRKVQSEDAGTAGSGHGHLSAGRSGDWRTRQPGGTGGPGKPPAT